MNRAFRWLPLLACLSLMSASGAADDGQGQAGSASPGAACFGGSFLVSDAAYFYVVNPTGAAFELRMRWQDAAQAEMDRPLLVRIFDPQEKRILRHDDPGERTPGPAQEHSATLKIPASGAGVYQVAVSAFACDFSFETEPALEYGVYASPTLRGKADQFRDSFIFIPAGLPRLPVRVEGAIERLSLLDEQGAAQLELRDVNPAGEVHVAPGAVGKVWKLAIESKADYRLGFDDLPVILCPSADAAKAIHASVDVLDDGTVCFHKFQIKIHDILKKYRAMPPSAFAVKPPVLVRDKAAWVRQPTRNLLLTGPYGVYSALDTVLQEQNLDASSPWFGTIGTWRRPGGGPRQDDPWAACDRLGLMQVSPAATVLGAVCSIGEPFNTLSHDEALKRRVIIACLQDLMLLREHELPLPRVIGYQGGDRAFVFPHFTQAFPWMIHECPPDVQAAWTEGIERFADRQAITQIASVVNQWTSIIRGLADVAAGTDDPWYGAMVKRHLRWLWTCNQWGLGQKPAGYYDEALGPDGTYAGISTHNLACVYERTKDKELLESLRRCINLLNHTVAPEPDGSWLGASSYAHRTPGDWSSPQWGAGIGMLADDLPEAAAHMGRAWMTAFPARDAQSLVQAEQTLTSRLAYLDRDAFRNQAIGPTVLAAGPEIAFAVWEHYAADPMRGTLPMVPATPFARNFGDEFFCVRRPGYYAMLYAGRSMLDSQKADRPRDAHKQHPRNGGGLSMFWSPAFGSSILGKNWSAYAAQTILAEHDGNADWEDYWSIQNVFDETSAEATITGRIMDQPMGFTRRWRFLDACAECQITLKADADARFDNMWECFPYPLDKPGSMRVTLLDESGQAIPPSGGRPASAVLFASQRRESHLIVFASPRACEIGVERCTDALEGKHEYGRVLAALPRQWKAGEERTSRWCMMPIPSGSAVEAVKALIQAMKAS